MTDEAPFVRAMEERPDDVYTRLVFADWLEEQGDPRGELLRCSHLLTQAIDVQDRPRLEASMRRLIDFSVPAVGPFWTNKIGMRFAWIPPGTFLMGSPALEYGRVADETPHAVTLTRGLFLGVMPVTQAQWQTTAENPSHFKGDDRPVENVSWEDCQYFCRQLSGRDGKPYRLPTEAEWEFACRAGSTTSVYFGEDPFLVREHAWFDVNSAGSTHPVGHKKGNAWGLYDMHGNVWQWCSDRYAAYPTGPAIDPQGARTGTVRVLRGGAWGVEMWFLRSAFRHGLQSDYRGSNVGLRICFNLN